MSRGRKLLHLGLNLAITVLLIAGLLPLAGIASAEASPGLINPGFEDDLGGWTKSEVDGAVVVSTENSSVFSTYEDMGGATISPYRGAHMLRLGTPKRESEKQASGYNTVTQTFTAAGETMRFAFRLFSWEHRGNDVLLISLKDSAGNPVGSLRMPDTDQPVKILMNGSNQTVSLNTPFYINVGKRGQYLDSGWTKAEIYDITPGSTLTLSYSVAGLDNSAHSSWGYFDNASNPPVAEFTYSPGSPWEGDFVEFVDQSYSDPSEPSLRITSWLWNIVWDVTGNGTDPNDPVSGSDLRNPFFIPVDQGKYIVTLKVTDSLGATGQVTHDVIVDNAPPAVNALNVEVLAGENASLFGRFIDPGWTDTHTAEWLIDGYDNPLAVVTEDNLAFMGTGEVRGEFPTAGISAGTDISGRLMVSDSDNVSYNVFTIHVVASEPQNAEPNENIGGAPWLESDNIHLSYIQSLGDVDVYEIVSANGTALPVGTEALVSLQDLPADYDLVLLSQRPAGLEPGGFQMGGFQMGGFQMGGYQMGGFQMGGFQMGGFQMGGFQMGGFQMGAFQMGGFQMGGFQMGDFQRAGYQMGGFQMGGFQMGGFQMGGYQMGGFQMGGFQMGGYQMGGYQMGDTGSAFYPISQVGAGTEGTANDNIGGSDISLSELGLSLEALSQGADGTVEVVGFSANRGLDDEVLLASVDTEGTRLFVVVAGANGAFNQSDPYALRVETSFPLPFAALLEAWGIPDYPAPVNDWADNPDNPWQGDGKSDIIHEFGGGDPKTLFVIQKQRLIGRYGDNATNQLISAYEAFSENSTIAGDIISVPISLYEAWDDDYSSIDAANNVAIEIQSIVRSYISSRPTIEYVVIMGTDDIVPFHRDPDMTTIGNERQYALTSFLKPGSPIFYSLLGGYTLTDDYLVDDLPILWQGRPSYVPDRSVARLVETPEEMIAQAAAFLASGGRLDAGSALVTGYDFFADGGQAVIDTLRAQGIDVDSLMPPDAWDAEALRNALLVSPANDINNINAHYTHYSAISAAGFQTDNFSDLLTSLQVGGANFFDTLVFSMGCHIGLSVPDLAAPDSSSLGLDINPQLDFAQALKGAVLLGSTGFGYGDDAGIGGTEYLMSIFTDQLFAGDPVSVGQALVSAKRNYRVFTSTWSVYDNKSSIEFELYGLPHYIVGDSSLSAESLLQGSGVTGAAETVGTASLPLTVTVDGEEYSYEYTLNEAQSGFYYSANGDYQSVAFRPIQPRVIIPLSTSGPDSVHGVALLGGNYTDDASFDPVISRPTNEWELTSEEIQLLPPTFWPAQLAVVNTLDTGGSLVQALVITPAQFRAQGVDNTGNIIGTERLYHDLRFALLSSNSSDNTPANIFGVDLGQPENGKVDVTVNASDPSGIVEIIVLKYENGQITEAGRSEDGSPVITIDEPGNAALIIQVVDGAGNVATATGKGASLSVINVDAADVPASENTPVLLSASLPGWDSLTKPVFYTWDLGDGSFSTGQSYDGTIEVWHTYVDDNPTGTPSDDYTTKLKVTDSGGGIGNAVVVVTVQDLAPVVSFTVTPSIDENGEVVLSGNFTDIGIRDIHTAEVDWGEGDPEALTLTENNGFGSFSATHQYLDDDPPGTASDTYTVTVTVTDDDTVSGSASRQVTVNDLAPSLDALSLSSSSIGENGILTVSGTFGDTGTKDSHKVEIDWGEGSVQVISVDDPAVHSFSVTHQYLDDDPSNTPADTYPVSVVVRDDDTLASGAVSSTVTVINVAPAVEAGLDQMATEDVPFTISSDITFSDVGTLDTHNVTIDWGDGTPSYTEDEATSPLTYPEHTYTDSGVYTVTVTVTDDDGGIGSDTLTVTVPEEWTDLQDVADPALIDGDLSGGSMDNAGGQLTIALRVYGDNISDQFQYRVYIQTPAGTTYQVKYDDGKVTGITEASAAVSGNTLTFSVPISSLGVVSGDRLYVSAEVQGGIKAGASQGKLDAMPDEGTFDYVVP